MSTERPFPLLPGRLAEQMAGLGVLLSAAQTVWARVKNRNRAREEMFIFDNRLTIVAAPLFLPAGFAELFRNRLFAVPLSPPTPALPVAGLILCSRTAVAKLGRPGRGHVP